MTSNMLQESIIDKEANCRCQFIVNCFFYEDEEEYSWCDDCWDIISKQPMTLAKLSQYSKIGKSDSDVRCEFYEVNGKLIKIDRFSDEPFKIVSEVEHNGYNSKVQKLLDGEWYFETICDYYINNCDRILISLYDDIIEEAHSHDLKNANILIEVVCNYCVTRCNKTCMYSNHKHACDFKILDKENEKCQNLSLY